jgi:hypothetical protein
MSANDHDEAEVASINENQQLNTQEKDLLKSFNYHLSEAV